MSNFIYPNGQLQLRKHAQMKHGEWGGASASYKTRKVAHHLKTLKCAFVHLKPFIEHTYIIYPHAHTTSNSSVVEHMADMSL